MAVPDYETMMLPMLAMFQNGAKTVTECVPLLQDAFQIADADAEVLLPSGRISVLASRAHWARTYLGKAGLLDSPRRNFHQITDLGRRVLAESPAKIDNSFLERFADFSVWRTGSRPQAQSDPQAPTIPVPSGSQTPFDSMETANKTLNSALRDDLLTILYDMNPVRFEQLILDLLTAMGYGKGDLSNSHMTKSSGDGGIDGIIYEDALGLDAVYIQAKRYAPDNKVSRPAIQQFVGSLNGEGATKGVFVTTSDFSAEAKAFLGKVQHRVVLINGQELARLMIGYNIGVRARMTYVIKSVDEDYFGEMS
jgi:restriction system protein